MHRASIKTSEAHPRRRFIKDAGAAISLVMLGCAPGAEPTSADAGKFVTYSAVIDLTHTLSPDFPTFGGKSQFSMETILSFEKDGANLKRWQLVEHTGTHLDAPFHFSADGDTADRIPIERLVVPLAVVDIRNKAATNVDAQLTLDDLRAWEDQHGNLPAQSCVALYSGWDKYVHSDKFRNADASGQLHFPGFHVDAVQFLLDERDVVGLAVDTLSLDRGMAPDFAVHRAWLPTNRWGLECVANLGTVPPSGATIVVGAPKVLNATGGPSRVLALV